MCGASEGAACRPRPSRPRPGLSEQLVLALCVSRSRTRTCRWAQSLLTRLVSCRVAVLVSVLILGRITAFVFC